MNNEKRFFIVFRIKSATKVHKNLHMCKKKSNFAANFENIMSFPDFWTTIQIRKWGKYVVTIVLFLVIFLFIGDQSLIQFVKRGREIRQLEEQRDAYRSASEKAQREIQTLHNADSLERYARVHYYMHEANEDIYLIDEVE